MKLPRLTTSQTIGLLIGAGALTLAACGSGSTGSTAASTPGVPSGAGGGAVVSMATVDGTQTLADAAGHTLYSTSAESGGHIVCTAGCTSFWQPVTATGQQARQASTALHQSFGLVSRPDGGTQLTYHGLPLYSFLSEGAHQLSGNGFSDSFNGTPFTWASALAPASASAAPSQTSGGTAPGGGMYGY